MSDRYKLELDDCLYGAILDTETGEYVCLVTTKRPDLEFEALKSLIAKANIQHEMAREDWKAIPEIMKYVNRQGIEDWYGKGAIKQLKRIEKKLIKIAKSVH